MIFAIYKILRIITFIIIAAVIITVLSKFLPQVGNFIDGISDKVQSLFSSVSELIKSH